MKPFKVTASVAMLLAAVLAGCDQPTISSRDIRHRVEASRDVTKVFGKTLKGHLQQAMQQGGPLQAIEVCHEIAPQLAGEMSRKTGWDIHRTSLKPRRTPPDDWERQVLEDLEKRKAAGEPVEQLEVHQITEKDGKPVFRYMKAIETKPICLVCHGKNIAPPVAEKIRQLYPNDQATGFEVGDIRGAFSIVQPLDKPLPKPLKPAPGLADDSPASSP